MTTKRYPLEAARTVRAVERDRAADALAEALRALDAAQARRARAAERLSALHAEAVDHDADRGTTSAAALQREHRFRERRREEERALRRALDRAQTEEQRAAEDVARARRAAQTASADVEVIERHRERWVASEARAAERADDDDER